MVLVRSTSRLSSAQTPRLGGKLLRRHERLRIRGGQLFTLSPRSLRRMRKAAAVGAQELPDFEIVVHRLPSSYSTFRHSTSCASHPTQRVMSSMGGKRRQSPHTRGKPYPTDTAMYPKGAKGTAAARRSSMSQQFASYRETMSAGGTSMATVWASKFRRTQPWVRYLKKFSAR